ncbi:MAG: hypothetical protein QOJ58_5298, partial [Alphaproteobacteria bacterium]|nr:hypothetical protein [Alphaproteobacteria bacterium]
MTAHSRIEISGPQRFYETAARRRTTSIVTRPIKFN